ncbi:MAG TPA: hypothetical protein VN345_03820 [Blastocatellia bacterium]|nr:hypothetical protein [Blastocatellia bacterium]
MPPGYKLKFAKWKPDRLAGIAQLQNYLEIIDTHQPHPFRPLLLGRPRFYLVVDDRQGEFIPDSAGALAVQHGLAPIPDRTVPGAVATGLGWTVRQPVDARGLARARAELRAYHYPQTADGQERDRPVKIFDDIIDPLKALADLFFPQSAATTDAEKFELRLPEHLRRENYDKLTFQERHNHDLARQTAFITYEYEKKQRQNQYVGWRQAIKNKYRDKGPWNS